MTWRLSVFVLIVLLAVTPLNSQTFRGAINGTVMDPAGAVVPNAQVKATDTATQIEHTSATTSDGIFAFQDLTVGTYKVTVTMPGFPVVTVDNVLVTQGSIYTLPVKLHISQQATTVEVSAATLSLDTTTATQTTSVTGTDLQTMPQNGRDFTQLIQLVPGYAGYSAGGYGSLNGTRANQVNWQIDGVDNNDLWHNVPAVNQGGVEGIAGIILPLDSVEQFSQQTQSSAESGRNPGGVVNIVTKSGTNQIHGTANYFNSAAPITGYSYNAVGKMDYVITPKHTLALRMFGGQGNQTAPVGTYNPYFFEQGPIHVYNWSAVVNSVLTPRFTNQVLLGVNYFNQIFFDANHNINPISFGFNTGAAQPQLSGAPGIKITGFDNLQNATPPSGRNDITGQASDSASLVIGKHQFRFSGEYRRGYVNEFYHRKTRGNFSFPGTQGPWGYIAETGFNSAPCQAQYGY